MFTDTSTLYYFLSVPRPVPENDYILYNYAFAYK
jgi:hypothetical protein